MSISLQSTVLYDVSPVESGTREKRHEQKQDVDAHLVARARGGEYRAFEELVTRYRNEVFALAYHYLHDREEAWDIAQEVFLKAHRALSGFRGDASFKTWLMRITANRCKDYFKKRRLRTVALEDIGGGENARSAQAGPDHAAESSELGVAIQNALGTLPEKHRTAFVLREYEGLSYEEMSKIMQCSLGTVMSRLHHARKKMQKALIDMGVVEGQNND